MLGTGGDWQVGRSYMTVGSGRILGTDDWDMGATNAPSAFSGWSYANNFGGVDLGLSWTNNDLGAFAGSNDGWWTISASFDMGSDMINGIDFASITQEDGQNAWWEATTGGAVSMFTWGATLGNYDDGVNSFSASAFNVGMNASDWSGGFIGNVGFEMTDSDGGFTTISAADHGSLGIADALNATGAWGGGADLSSTTISLDLNVMEGWNTGLAMISTEQGGVDGDEMDLTVGRSFGGGVDGWLGYGDGDAYGTDFTVYYVQLSLAF